MKMKKSKIIIFVSIILSVLAFTITSCSKDNDVVVDEKPSETPLVEYEIKLDGAVFASGKEVELGMMEDSDGNWNNVINFESNGVITIVNTSPKSVGEVTMSANGDPGLVFLKGTEVYNTTSGKLIRVSENEITFSGSCVRLSDSKTFTISGFVKSDDLKVIVE